MGEFGEFLGWATGACFFAAILNFAVKRIGRRWVASLPKESALRGLCQRGIRLIVSSHRYFGLGAAAIAAVHLSVQAATQFLSFTGVAAAVLLWLTALLGALLLWGRRRVLLIPHRICAAAGAAVFLLHLLIKL